MNETNLIQLIERKLRRRDIKEIKKDGLMPSAVLVPIYKEDGNHKIILTKRTDLVEHHKGQISFPGGRMDEEDLSPEVTALREAHEEIGLHPNNVKILGKLDPEVTTSNYHVEPYVGYIKKSFEPSINPIEVERIIAVPLQFILDPASLSIKEVKLDGINYITEVFDYNGEWIWGATARILCKLRDVLSGHQVKNEK